MNYSELEKKAKSIKPVSQETVKKALKRQECLAKPPGSLGELEEISVRIAGMTGKVTNSINRGCVTVFCSDNGVVEEGIASAPQTVTAAQTINFTRRKTGVGALADSFGSELLIVDMGVKEPIPEFLYDGEPLRDTHKIVNRRIRPETGETDNLSKTPAMSEKEALKAIETGFEMADAVADAGFDIMGIGEMGIGNTTTSAALLSAITGKSSDETVGRGGGVNDRGFARKKEIVDKVSRQFRETGGIINGWIVNGENSMNARGNTATNANADSSKNAATKVGADSSKNAVTKVGADSSKDVVTNAGADSSKNAATNAGVDSSKNAATKANTDSSEKITTNYGADSNDNVRRNMIKALALMGGFDICAMTGAFLGAANRGLPVVIDGYISAVAALCAYMIAPGSRDYMIASHKSFEKGYSLAIDVLQLKPFLSLDMRLGEGSGCPIAFRIIKGACDVMANMATFEEAAIDDEYLEEIRSEERFKK